MPTLREIKSRVSAVRSTLKITGAMKLVASTKLQKAQRRIQAMIPYEKALREMMEGLPLDPARCRGASGAGRTAIIAFASNNSLCGSFNHNVIRATLEEIATAGGVPGLATNGRTMGAVDIFPVGKKMTDALHRAGYGFSAGFVPLSAEASYEEAAHLADLVVGGFLDGEYDRVLLVYTHFISPASQKVTVEQLLPLPAAECPDEARADKAAAGSLTGETDFEPASANLTGEIHDGVILEPGREELSRRLVPKALRIKVFAAMLDNSASEHAARALAMQLATENAEKLLDTLTLEYNKSRQQKITSEILDLANNA